jgi:hypothetical protein
MKKPLKPLNAAPVKRSVSPQFTTASLKADLSKQATTASYTIQKQALNSQRSVIPKK